MVNLFLTRFSVEFSRPQIRVFSSVFSNLTAGWLITLFVTKDLFVLTGNFLNVILSLYFAVKLEEILEEL